MQVPAPNFPWLAHPNKQPAVHAVLSHVGVVGVQVPAVQMELAPQSLSAQQAAEQTQAFPLLV